MDPIGIDIPFAGDILPISSTPDGRLGTGGILPILTNAVDSAWRDDVRPRLTDVLKAELGKADRFAEGFTLYNIVVNLAAGDPLKTIQRTDSGDVLIHVETGRSTVIATSTQPSFLGSYADPRFSIDFSVSFDLLLDIPPVTGPVGGSKVLNLQLVAPHLDSQNLPADAILAVAELIVSFVTGGDVDNLVESAAAGALGSDQVNGALAPLNEALDGLLTSGHRYLSLLVGDPDSLLRQLGAHAGDVAGVVRSLPAGTQSLVLLCREPDQSGVVEGEVSWPDSAGEPVDRARFAMISPIAQGFLTGAALDLVRARTEGEPVAGRLVAADRALESTRLTAAADGFAAAPLATQVQQGSLAGSPGVRLWDAAVEEEPPGVADTAALDLADARLSLRALQPEAYESIMDVFRRGPKQFVLTCLAGDPGGGSHPTGHMVAMWHDSSDGWQRRRFRIEDVETGTPLTVTCALDPEWRWVPGEVERVSPRNWSGTVTVQRAREFAELLRDGDLQVSFATGDGSRRTSSIAALEAAGALTRDPAAGRALVIESGTPGDEVALNPQPLPPRWRERLAGSRGDDRAIIVVGGRNPGDEVSLNPQPLPPRWRDQVGAWLEAVQPQGGGGGAFQLRQRDQGGEELLGARGGVFIREPVGRAAGRGILLGGGGAEGLVARGGGSFLIRAGAGAAAVAGGRRREPQVSAVIQDAAKAVVTTVDHFGDLVTEIDPDILVPDTVNPTGYGTVRGIDFRVWPAG